MKIDLERNDNGRWIARIRGVADVTACGSTREEAAANVKALAALGASKSFDSFLKARSSETGDVSLADVRKKRDG